MTTTEQVVDQAIDKLDETPPKDSPSEPAEDPKDPAPVEPRPKEGEEAPKDPEDPKPDEGYVADDAEELEEEPTQPDKPAEPTERGQYILDNLPSISVRGKNGENGQVKTFTVKRAQDLPDNFQFASVKDQTIFNQDLADQTLRANQFNQQYDNEQQTKQFEEFNAKDNLEVREDITALQKEGLLPKFKLQPGDPKFDGSDEVKEVQKVLDFREEANNKYAKDGKLYRLSFRDAFDLFNARNPKEDKEQSAEDKARREVTRRTAGTGGDSPAKAEKPRVRSGTTVDQILEMHEMDWS